MRLLPAVFILAALALPAVGQEPAETFGESIDVRVVNVEAVVTNRNGRLVQGLSAGDFRLLVDGREVPIEFFSEIVEGEAVSRPAGEGGTDEALAPAPVLARQGRSVLVFIDESFSTITHRNQVLRHIVEDLALLGPEDEMAVVAFDGLELDRLSGWSGDAAALAGVLKAAEERPSWGLRIVAALRSEASTRELVSEAGSQDDSSSDGEINGIGKTQEKALLGLAPSPQIYSRYVKVPEAASAALRAFAGEARGRKVLLYLSGGPSSPRLARDANQFGFTIYPVDVQGIDTTFVSNDAGSSGPAPLLFDPRERLIEEGFESLAQATGGKVSLNGNRERALERAVEDTRVYYWLGFTPSWRGDDRSHSIRLEMRQRDLTARSRRGFTDLSPMRETARQTEEILMLGGEARSRLVRVELGTPEPVGALQVRIPVLLDVPFESLTPLPQAEGFAVRVILSAGAVDKNGGRSGLTQVPLNLALPQAPAPGSFAKFRSTVTVRRTEQRLVFTLRDPVTDTVLWGETEFRP